jgi:type I restriction enzyme, S subunit
MSIAATVGLPIITAIPACIHDGFVALEHLKGVDQTYLLYVLNSLEDDLRGAGQTGSQSNVNTEIVKRLTISLAPEIEQRTIAEALRDTDHQIEALKRLIAKKEAIKQGMMQQLLTGETRLAGFIQPWRQAVLADFAHIVSGGTPTRSSPAYWDGGIAWCTPTDITNEPGRYLHTTKRTISEVGLANSSAYLLPKGSLLLCTRATIGEVKIAVGPIATNQGFKSLIPKSNVCSEFLYYKLLTLKALLVGLGSGSTFLEISKRDIAGLPIEAPSFEEQLAIARVLMDADDEIDALRSRLAKAKSIKRGMMQELLTGRTRLPVMEDVAA